MNERTKTMSLLAACRPSYFDQQGEMHRRQSDLRRAISASVSPSRIVALNFNRAVRASDRTRSLGGSDAERRPDPRTFRMENP